MFWYGMLESGGGCWVSKNYSKNWIVWMSHERLLGGKNTHVLLSCISTTVQASTQVIQFAHRIRICGTDASQDAVNEAHQFLFLAFLRGSIYKISVLLSSPHQRPMKHHCSGCGIGPQSAIFTSEQDLIIMLGIRTALPGIQNTSHVLMYYLQQCCKISSVITILQTPCENSWLNRESSDS